MSEYEGYSAIACVYDRLNVDIDYKKWADFFENCFDRFLQKKTRDNSRPCLRYGNYDALTCSSRI